MENHKGYVYLSEGISEHRIVAAQKLGRPLKDEEVVHHVNEIKNDNRPENLWIFASIADHTSFHHTHECWQDEEGIYHSIFREHKCLNCGVKIDRHAKYCKACWDVIQRQAERPSREELKYLIRTTPFTTIGKQYNVSDNAIRKWCKTENLPYRSKDIKQFSDKEWQLL